jgi:tellurite resistance protein
VTAPLITVLRGEPDDAEVAALVAALVAVSDAADEPDRGRVMWHAPAIFSPPTSWTSW